MNIKLKLESYLKGGYPIRECIDFWIFSKLDFYDELIDLISNSKKEEAIDLATKNFEAYNFFISSTPVFGEGVLFISSKNLQILLAQSFSVLLVKPCLVCMN